MRAECLIDLALHLFVFDRALDDEIEVAARDLPGDRVRRGHVTLRVVLPYLKPSTLGVAPRLKSLQHPTGASVERGQGWLARLAGAVIGFPAAIADTPVRVRFDAENGIETWTRSFGAETFHSAQFAGTGRAQGLIQEKFGPLTFAMALVLLQNQNMWTLPLGLMAFQG